ncbi:MAG: TRAP transporter large permease [Halanaerobiales bacterium]
MAIVVILIFGISLLLGLPIAFVLGLTSLSVAYFEDYILVQWAQRFFSGLDSFTLLAVPFFILAGELMNTGGITNKLIDFAQYVVGRIKGGLGLTNVLVSMLFAGISGAAVADTSAIGSVMIPSMIEKGYDREYSTAITVASGAAGPIIPPSILMVLYGITTGVGIGGLFIAGIIPGIIMGIGMMILAYIFAKINDYPRMEKEFKAREFLIKLKDVTIPLLAPVIIVGGILSGIFTPTEAASVAVLYAFIVSVFVFKETNLCDLPEILFSTAKLTGVILIIVGFADTFAWIVSMNRIGQTIALQIQSFTTSPLVFLLLVNIFLLIVGMFMEAGAAILVLAPILAPVAAQYGIHQLHFGFIMVLNLTIALSTPPLGLSLFVGSKISGLGLKDLSIAIFPFILYLVLILFLLTYVPAISMWLPKLSGLY